VTLAPQAPASRRPAPRDRFRGALLGLAVGDALGAPAEFLTELEVRDRWGVLDEMVGGGCHDVAPGEVTDATEMMLALADSLVALGEFDPQDVVDRYRAWFAAGPSDVSLTTRTVMLALAAGTPWDLAARRAYEVLGFPTAGNGSVMRCAPLALRFFNDPDTRRRVSLRESRLTHYDSLAGWSCVALNELLVAGGGGGRARCRGARRAPPPPGPPARPPPPASKIRGRWSRPPCATRSAPIPSRSTPRPSCSTRCGRRCGRSCTRRPSRAPWSRSSIAAATATRSAPFRL
jgi:hypothetical protein